MGNLSSISALGHCNQSILAINNFMQWCKMGGNRRSDLLLPLNFEICVIGLPTSTVGRKSSEARRLADSLCIIGLCTSTVRRNSSKGRRLDDSLCSGIPTSKNWDFTDQRDCSSTVWSGWNVFEFLWFTWVQFIPIILAFVLVMHWLLEKNSGEDMSLKG